MMKRGGNTNKGYVKTHVRSVMRSFAMSLKKRILKLFTIACLLSLCTTTSSAVDKPKLIPPKQINVCGRVVHIQLVHFIGDTPDGKAVAGITEGNLIKLVDTRPEGDMAATLQHEIMHVVLTTNVSDKVFTVHEFIIKLAPCYNDTIFHSNPDLLVYLIGAGYHYKLDPEDSIYAKR